MWDNDGICSSSQSLFNRVQRLKMNYRAWNHRCWLVSYMTREQVNNLNGSIITKQAVVVCWRLNKLKPFVKCIRTMVEVDWFQNSVSASHWGGDHIMTLTWIDFDGFNCMQLFTSTNRWCWIFYSQVLDELKKSKTWAGLHVADSSSFNYRRVSSLSKNFILPFCCIWYDNWITWPNDKNMGFNDGKNFEIFSSHTKLHRIM